jgi:hypothetical protein
MEKYRNIAIQAFIEGKSEEEVMIILSKEECNSKFAERIVNIYHQRHKEGLEQEELIKQCVTLLFDGFSAKTVFIIAMMKGGELRGAKAASDACRRCGMVPSKALEGVLPLARHTNSCV